MTTPLAYQAIAPSNIAMIKYWGKADELQQWPSNDSVSMTLSSLQSRTIAQVHGGSEHLLHWHGQELIKTSPQFTKIIKHLDRIALAMESPDKLEIWTHNTFPHGCGIASSASGFAALTLAAAMAFSQSCNWQELESKGITRDLLRTLSRLGSGSACRSLDGGFVHWIKGAHPSQQQVESVFAQSHWPLSDIVCIVDRREKQVSSSAGHRTAATSPLFHLRLAGLPERTTDLISAISRRDFQAFGRIIEAEALEMHAVMMSSQPTLHYLTKKTIDVLSWIRERRMRGDLPGFFTLDAGPNIHLICERQHTDHVVQLLRRELPEIELMTDEIGSGSSLRVLDHWPGEFP